MASTPADGEDSPEGRAVHPPASGGLRGWLLGAVLCGLALLAALAVVIGLAPADAGAAPRAFGGHFLLVVVSGSMVPAIQPGDLLLDKALDPDEAAHLAVGQVVTLRRSDALVTHRIARVAHDADGVAYVTSGDANATPDAEPVGAHDVLGAVRIRVPLLGGWLGDLRDPRVAVLVVAVVVLLGIAVLLGRAARR